MDRGPVAWFFADITQCCSQPQRIHRLHLPAHEKIESGNWRQEGEQREQEITCFPERSGNTPRQRYMKRDATALFSIKKARKIVHAHHKTKETLKTMLKRKAAVQALIKKRISSPSDQEELILYDECILIDTEIERLRRWIQENNAACEKAREEIRMTGLP